VKSSIGGFCKSNNWFIAEWALYPRVISSGSFLDSHVFLVIQSDANRKSSSNRYFLRYFQQSCDDFIKDHSIELLLIGKFMLESMSFLFPHFTFSCISDWFRYYKRCNTDSCVRFREHSFSLRTHSFNPSLVTDPSHRYIGLWVIHEVVHEVRRISAGIPRTQLECVSMLR